MTEEILKLMGTVREREGGREGGRKVGRKTRREHREQLKFFASNINF